MSNFEQADPAEKQGPEGPQNNENTQFDVETPDGDKNAPGAPSDGSNGDVFPREYVENLRRENSRYREKAKTAEARLHVALVAATGKLADPNDLPFNADHLDDADALNAAIDSLIGDKPHLRSRKPAGDVGQGNRGGGAGGPSWSDLLRG